MSLTQPKQGKAKIQPGMLAKQAGEQSNLPTRHRTGSIWLVVFQASMAVGIIALCILLLKIINDSFGLMIFEFQKDPLTLTASGAPLETMPKDALEVILKENVSKGRFNTLEKEKSLSKREQQELYNLVVTEVLKPKVLKTYPLLQSIIAREEIYQFAVNNYPGAFITFRAWVNWNFITSPQSSDPLTAGISNAILGSLFSILVAMLFAVPIGTGAAIYLEEYARNNWINRFIRTNINNLAGVPSVIYGILGLAIFVRLMEPVTSGAIFGLSSPGTANGRTILSAGLTLGLLVLPLVIINAQEAIRSVPRSLREASYGLGGTKWQTVWHHVLPNAIPGTLTGTILAMSRAIGETAPLILIGASTFITYNPTSGFSKFTSVPVQIYQWTARPQDVWRNLAAAAIIVLLVMLLSLNAIAILLRNRYARRLV
jgi:phosphate transport system permease protein